MIELRELNSDVAEGVALYKQCIRSLYKSIKYDAEKIGIMNFDATYTDEDFWNRVRDKTRNFYWIVADNNIVGILTTRNLGDSVKISNLYVMEEHRGYGYASEAIKLLKKSTERPILLHCYYEGQAERLYRKLGFKTVYVEMLLE